MWKICVILVGLAMAGCNANPTNTQTKSQSTVNTVHRAFTESMRENVLGRYTSSCHESYYQGLSLYAITVEVFRNGALLNRALYFYKDSACQISFGQAEEDGRFEFTDGGVAFGIQYSHFKPETVMIANLLNSSYFCGRQGWQAGIWTTTLDQGYELAMQMLSPEDDEGNVLLRTECSYVSPERCVDVRLVRTSAD